ncbi:MAG: tyrosine-type recombinase/integrase [Clostridiales bacterium]|nr:tyrosine-type recombinase/integrase [Clostridiales bacterium]
MKNASSRRSLPLIPQVAQALRAEYAKQEEYRRLFGDQYIGDPNGYICVNCFGELLRPSYVTDHFKYLLRKTHMRKIRFHDLRHTCASLLALNGVPLLKI